MKRLQSFLIAVFSVVAFGMFTEYLFGSKALMGMVSGILLITWIRIIYDKIEENEE